MNPKAKKSIKPGRVSTKLGREILILVGFTTLVFTPSLTIDAFNPPKFAVLVSGMTYIGAKHWKIIGKSLRQRPVMLFSLAVFTLLSLVLFANTNSISERMYGIQGRNFGLITIITFISLGFYSFQATKVRVLNSGNILNGLALTNFGVCLVFYLQESRIWSTEFQNDYKVLPSTLGNPNFLSAFLGISVQAVAFWTIQNRKKPSLALPGFLVSLYAIYVIVVSGSIQGLFALAISSIFIAIIYCLKYLGKVLNFIILSLLAIFVLVLASGVLGIGFFGERLLQPTLLNRIIYWRIGTRMVLDAPFLGKGYDAYLDNYRGFVTESDYETLGGPVISDSPHNIFLDLTVSGGLILGLSCVFIALLTVFLGFISIKKQIEAGRIDIAKLCLFSSFLGLIAVSLISPFQIGLFVWLPIMIGTLLGVCANKDPGQERNLLIDAPRSNKSVSVALSSCLFIPSFIIAALPLYTEIRFRVAVEESSFIKLEKVALAWPFSGPRAISIAQGLHDSSINSANGSPEGNVLNQIEVLQRTAIAIALEAVRINERQFESWRFLLRNSPDTMVKNQARQKLQELDPINPEWKLLP